MAILKSTTVAGTGAIQIPTGTTAERPAAPVDGMLRINTTLNTLERYIDTIWRYTPDIVRSGLIFNLDVAEPASYPATGNTLFDLTNNNYDLTLFGDPAYSSSNGGFITLNEGSSGGTGGLIGGNLIFDLSIDSYTKSEEIEVKNYTSFGNGKLPAPDLGTTVAAFGYPVAVSVDYVRTIQTKNRVDLTRVTSVYFKVNAATSGTWGDPPDGNGEAIHLEYSNNGTSWAIIKTILPSEVPGGRWYEYQIDVPLNAKISGGVFLRYRQTKSSLVDIPRDVWAVTSIIAVGSGQTIERNMENTLISNPSETDGNISFDSWSMVTTAGSYYVFSSGSQTNSTGIALSYQAGSPVCTMKTTTKSVSVNLSDWALNTWIHWSGVSNGSVLKIYKNGIFSSSGAWSNASNTDTEKNLTIGRASHTGSFYSAMKFGALRFWNRALTDQEVIQNFNATRGRFGV